MLEDITDQMTAAFNIQVSVSVSIFIIDLFEVIHIDHDHGEFKRLWIFFDHHVEFIGLFDISCLTADTGQSIGIGFLTEVVDLFILILQVSLCPLLIFLQGIHISQVINDMDLHIPDPTIDLADLILVLYIQIDDTGGFVVF